METMMDAVFELHDGYVRLDGREVLHGIDLRIRAGEVIEDDVRIHQRNAIIGEEGRRFQEGVEPRKLIDVPEERNWPMYKRSFGDDQRNRDPTHIRRIKHSDELHKVSSLASRATSMP